MSMGGERWAGSERKHLTLCSFAVPVPALPPAVSVRPSAICRSAPRPDRRPQTVRPFLRPTSSERFMLTTSCPLFFPFCRPGLSRDSPSGGPSSSSSSSSELAEHCQSRPFCPCSTLKVSNLLTRLSSALASFAAPFGVMQVRILAPPRPAFDVQSRLLLIQRTCITDSPPPLPSLLSVPAVRPPSANSWPL